MDSESSDEEGYKMEKPKLRRKPSAPAILAWTRTVRSAPTQAQTLDALTKKLRRMKRNLATMPKVQQEIQALEEEMRKSPDPGPTFTSQQLEQAREQGYECGVMRRQIMEHDYIDIIIESISSFLLLHSTLYPPISELGLLPPQLEEVMTPDATHLMRSLHEGLLRGGESSKEAVEYLMNREEGHSAPYIMWHAAQLRELMSSESEPERRNDSAEEVMSTLGVVPLNPDPMYEPEVSIQSGSESAILRRPQIIPSELEDTPQSAPSQTQLPTPVASTPDQDLLAEPEKTSNSAPTRPGSRSRAPNVPPRIQMLLAELNRPSQSASPQHTSAPVVSSPLRNQVHGPVMQSQPESIQPLSPAPIIMTPTQSHSAEHDDPPQAAPPQSRPSAPETSSPIQTLHAAPARPPTSTPAQPQPPVSMLSIPVQTLQAGPNYPAQPPGLSALTRETESREIVIPHADEEGGEVQATYTLRPGRYQDGPLELRLPWLERQYEESTSSTSSRASSPSAEEGEWSSGHSSPIDLGDADGGREYEGSTSSGASGGEEGMSSSDSGVSAREGEYEGHTSSGASVLEEPSVISNPRQTDKVGYEGSCSSDSASPGRAQEPSPSYPAIAKPTPKQDVHPPFPDPSPFVATAIRQNVHQTPPDTISLSPLATTSTIPEPKVVGKYTIPQWRTGGQSQHSPPRNASQTVHATPPRPEPLMGASTSPMSETTGNGRLAEVQKSEREKRHRSPEQSKGALQHDGGGRSDEMRSKLALATKRRKGTKDTEGEANPLVAQKGNTVDASVKDMKENNFPEDRQEEQEEQEGEGETGGSEEPKKDKRAVRPNLSTRTSLGRKARQQEQNQD